MALTSEMAFSSAATGLGVSRLRAENILLALPCLIVESQRYILGPLLLLAPPQKCPTRASLRARESTTLKIPARVHEPNIFVQVQCTYLSFQRPLFLCVTKSRTSIVLRGGGGR